MTEAFKTKGIKIITLNSDTPVIDKAKFELKNHIQFR